MARKEYTTTAYTDVKDFIYGSAKNPVKLKNGMVIGGGDPYPELNFTLPTMVLNDSTWPTAVDHYREIITKTCQRAHELECPGFTCELETLPAMTFKPEWTIEVTKVCCEIISEYQHKYGIKGAFRITPNDNREGDQVDHMYKGPRWDETMKAFEGSGKVKGDCDLIFAIETIGGKEVHDDALMMCDLKKDVFAYAAIACPDMEKIWTAIVDIAKKTDTIPGGDTACGLANTAMVLAEKNYIPRVFAAVDRVMAGVRSLVAMEVGCTGPDKDCGYEGPYVKAISGNPIAMEGKTASCAHLSACGNIAMAVCDLWSNESVQNIQLLSGIAPVASFETLEYDCRMLRTAKKKGYGAQMQEVLVDSDSLIDPHAWILRPDVVLEISKGIVKETGYYNRTKAACKLSIESIKKASDSGKLRLNDREKEALGQLIDQADELPATLDELWAQVKDDCDKFDPKKYDLPYKF
jgi:methanol--5-hydroxybenzimidazolylcobamide Co-methyltransferase